MKQFNPLRVSPNMHQFYELTKDKLSQSAHDTLTARATRNFCKTAENIFGTRFDPDINAGCYLF
jgi:hypothetical protein